MIRFVLRLASKLIPKRRIVRWVCREVGEAAKAKKRFYLHRVHDHIVATPTNVDNEAWGVLLQLIDPDTRTPEMTQAMQALLLTVKNETLHTDTVLDDGVDLVLGELLEL